MKHRVYINASINAFRELQSLYPSLDLHFPLESEQGTPEELSREAMKSSAIVTLLSDTINRDFLEKHSHLKVIANFAVGFNNIDTDCAKDFGIPIGNTPNTLTHSTAETALTLLLMLSRKTNFSQRLVKGGHWKKWEPELFNGCDLRGKNFGIIGFGRIGREFSRMAYHLWGANILVYPRSSAQDLKTDFPYKVVSEEEFYLNIDVLSLHCPLTPETKSLINKEFIDNMKRPFFFINTARGQCHNEGDLYNGLRSNQILGVGLDVTDPEPMDKESPLLQRDDVVVLPHIGSATDRTRKEMAKQCLENIQAALESKPLPFPCLKS